MRAALGGARAALSGNPALVCRIAEKQRGLRRSTLILLSYVRDVSAVRCGVAVSVVPVFREAGEALFMPQADLLLAQRLAASRYTAPRSLREVQGRRRSPHTFARESDKADVGQQQPVLTDGLNRVLDGHSTAAATKGQVEAAALRRWSGRAWWPARRRLAVRTARAGCRDMGSTLTFVVLSRGYL
jgi:hypothetical protein